jgi:hypothetical protein
MKTGRVVAESWSGYYAPFVARHVTLIPKFSSAPTAPPVLEFCSRVLRPERSLKK